MNDEFDIIEYLSGLTSYIFDKAVLKNIALERGVSEVTSFQELDSKTKDLLRADLLYAAYLSPNVWASSTHTHVNFTKSVGHQTIYAEERDRIYNSFINIYRKYEDPKLEEADGSGSNLQWLDCWQ